ncbi:uncharacterized protein LOC144536452 [Sander vitreus]
MDTWKIQLVVVTFCALVQTYQALSSSVEEERGLSKDWQDESLEAGLTPPMASLMKRSKALRFYGLMGKRSGIRNPFKVNRRNKGEMFVGLMGRSISSGKSLTRIFPSATTTAIDVSEKPHKQGMIVPVKKPEVVLFLCAFLQWHCCLHSFFFFLNILSKSKYLFFVAIIPLFGRFIRGMVPNPVLMELEKKSTHFYDLYNFTPTKEDVTIHHTPQNTLCLRFQFMLTIIVLSPNKNYHLQNAHFLNGIKNNAARCRHVLFFSFFSSFLHEESKTFMFSTTLDR